MKKIFLFIFVLLTMRADATYEYINNQRAAGATTNGSSPDNAWASITNWFNTASGSTGLIAHVHNELISGALTLRGPSAVSSTPNILICVDTNGWTQWTTGAKATTQTGSGITFYGQGYNYIYGVGFWSGSGNNNTSIALNQNNASWSYSFDNCDLAVTNIGNGSSITFGIVGSVRDQYVSLNNTRMWFGASGQTISSSQCYMRWCNTTNAINGVTPTNLFRAAASGANPVFEIKGVDLSPVTAMLVNQVSATTMGYFRFIDCKLGAGVTPRGGVRNFSAHVKTELINCDSADTNYRYYKGSFEGDLSYETTIVRTSGATDGTTAFSRRMDSSIYSQWWDPLESEWIYGWLGSSVTNTDVVVAIPIVNDGTTLTTADCWLKTEFLGTTGFPLGLYKDSSNTNLLNSSSSIPTSTLTWTTTGLGSPVKQILANTIKVQKPGWFRSKVCLAKASTTIYVDPLYTNGFTRAYMTLDGVVNGGTASTPPTGVIGSSGLLMIMD